MTKAAAEEAYLKPIKNRVGKNQEAFYVTDSSQPGYVRVVAKLNEFDANQLKKDYVSRLTAEVTAEKKIQWEPRGEGILVSQAMDKGKADNIVNQIKGKRVGENKDQAFYTHPATGGGERVVMNFNKLQDIQEPKSIQEEKLDLPLITKFLNEVHGERITSGTYKAEWNLSSGRISCGAPSDVYMYIPDISQPLETSNTHDPSKIKGMMSEYTEEEKKLGLDKILKIGYKAASSRYPIDTYFINDPTVLQELQICAKRYYEDPSLNKHYKEGAIQGALHGSSIFSKLPDDVSKKIGRDFLTTRDAGATARTSQEANTLGQEGEKKDEAELKKNFPGK